MRDLGMEAADDSAILATAVASGRVLASADRDFGTLVARTHATSPSFLLGRRGRRVPELAALIADNLPIVEDDLAAGAVRDAALERITLELDRIKTIRTTASKTPKTSDASKASTARKSASGSGESSTDEAAHVKAECALRDHPALGRWLRQQPSGRLVINRAKVAAEERLDGKYLLTTSDLDLSAEDIALGYKDLLETERVFRDMKSTLELRPAFHHLEPRIRAHVLSCSAGSRCSSSASPNDAPG